MDADWEVWASFGRSVRPRGHSLWCNKEIRQAIAVVSRISAAARCLGDSLSWTFVYESTR